MGLDIYGWRNCAVQKELAEGFLGKLKMRSYKEAVDERLPEDKRQTVKVSLTINDETTQLDYSELEESVQWLQARADECSSCPLANGIAYGCYRYVPYPIDETTETLIYCFVEDALTKPETIVRQLVLYLLGEDRPEYTAFHDREDGVMAELEAPLQFVFDVPGEEEDLEFDTAQVLSEVLCISPDPPGLDIIAPFWAEFFDWLDQELSTSSTEVSIEHNGIQIAIHDTTGESPDLWKHAALDGVAESVTLSALRSWLPLLQTIYESDGKFEQVVSG